MSKVKQLASQARSLQSNPDFLAIVEEIKAGAVALFLDPNSDTVALTDAHARIRAIETFQNAIKARIDAEIYEDKKGNRDRAND